jgi:very-short-patch-repair endonuclease
MGDQCGLCGMEHVEVIERIALLEAAGWVVVRFSARMLSRPDVVVARVRDKLRAAGCPI